MSNRDPPFSRTWLSSTGRMEMSDLSEQLGIANYRLAAAAS